MRKVHCLSGTLTTLFVFLSLVGPCDAGEVKPAKGDKSFTVQMKIDFEVEEVNIPGWEDGAYSEPVGEGEVELRLVFNKTGGFPTVQIGEAKIHRYGCKGSAGCICTAAPELFSRIWSPIIFENVQWDPETEIFKIKGPVTYPEDLTNIKVNCQGISASIDDHPLYKILGAFIEDGKQQSKSVFKVPLVGEAPWTKTYSHQLFALGPKVFRADIVIIINEGGSNPDGP